MASLDLRTDPVIHPLGFDIQILHTDRYILDLLVALLLFTFVQCFNELAVRKAILFLITTSTIGFLAELLGTNTGFPFGKYYYTDFLDPKVFGVPEVVPLIWFVISYLTFSIARNVFRSEQLLENDLLRLALFGAVAWDFD
jgi:uncharacterized membrane protein